MTSGLNVKRLVWTIVFLGITLAAIVMEVVAGVWHPAGTIPWTEYIAAYVPWPIQLAAYVALAVWLPFHFWRADQKRKKAFTAGVHEGLAAARANVEANLGLASTRELLEEVRARGQTEPYDTVLGESLAATADQIIKTLPGSMLTYRTTGARG